MNAFIIFDVSAKEKEVIAAMRNAGYFSSWVSTGTEYFLPHNCMWKPNCELLQAKEDINAAISAAKATDPGTVINLDRCIVLSVNPWEGIAGTKIV